MKEEGPAHLKHEGAPAGVPGVSSQGDFKPDMQQPKNESFSRQQAVGNGDYQAAAQQQQQSLTQGANTSLGQVPSTSAAQHAVGAITPSQSAVSAASVPGSGHAAVRPAFRGSMEALTPEQRSYVIKQQRWLVFLRHCSKCTAQGTSCKLYGQNCHVAKQLWQHILKCHNPECTYARCSSSMDLLKHHHKCEDSSCLICVPVRHTIKKLQQQQQQQVRGVAECTVASPPRCNPPDRTRAARCPQQRVALRERVPCLPHRC